jgi:hypothetical protein
MFLQHRLGSAKSYRHWGLHKLNLFTQRPTRGPLPSLVRECAKREYWA